MAERLVISRLGAAGDGVADSELGSRLVPFALPGETVIVDGDGRRPRLLDIEIISPQRIEPFCTYFGACGGCATQHLEAGAYAAWKRDRVVGALARQGLEPDVDALADGHGEGRRRIVLHVRRGEDGVRAGLMEPGTHRLVALESCPITVPALARAPHVAEAIGRVVGMDKPLDVAVTATDAGLDVDLRGSGAPGARKMQSLIAAAQTLDLARLSIHGDSLIERRPPAVGMGASQVVPPPGAFLQATAAGEAELADTILAAAENARRVVDMFSGVGPFALRLAQRAEVHAVEGQAAMLAALDRAARQTQGLRRVTTEARDLFRRPLLPSELERFDLAVLDPPRQGAEAQVRQVALSSLTRVIMVSCDAVTFARDAATLVAGGFALERVRPVDQFKWSAHVEMVGVFRRPSPARRRRRS